VWCYHVQNKVISKDVQVTPCSVEVFSHEHAFSTPWQIPASTCLVPWREPRAERLAKPKQKGVLLFSYVSCTVPKATQPDFPVRAQMHGEDGEASQSTTQITFKTVPERQSLRRVTADGAQSQPNPLPQPAPLHRPARGCPPCSAQLLWLLASPSPKSPPNVSLFVFLAFIYSILPLENTLKNPQIMYLELHAGSFYRVPF